jgi:L-fucose isomerase-like protein
MLNDEGMVAGCEGDIPSTVGMITLAEISGNPAFMGNPSFIDGHRLVLAHCTVATKLVKAVHYRSHFESGIGVALAGQFRKGTRVTVARYGKGYDVLRAGGGTIVRGKPWSTDLCRTQVEIRMDGNADMFWKQPMGNHLVMTYGNHVDSLRNLASITDTKFEEV